MSAFVSIQRGLSRGAPLLLCAALLGCGPKVEPGRRTAPDLTAPTKPTSSSNSNKNEDADLALPPPSWHTGQFEGPALSEMPVIRWRTVLDGPITTAPTTDGERLFVTAGGAVYAFGLEGRLLWKAPVKATSPAARVEGGVAVGVEGKKVARLDLSDGHVTDTWSASASVRGAPFEVDGVVTWVTTEGHLGDAKGLDQAVGVSSVDTASLQGSTIYFATLEGRLYAVEKGKPVWEVKLPAGGVGSPTLSSRGVFQGIAAADGVPGGVAAYTDNGELRWKYQTRFQPAAGIGLGGAAVYAPDKDGHLYALSLADGSLLWKSEGFSEFTTRPAIVGSSLYVGNGDGSLYRVDLDDGGVVWTVPLGAAPTGDPIVVRGVIYLGLANGSLLALGAPE